MAWYNFNKNETKQEVVVNEPLYSSFSTPFGKIGDGNLSLPYVRSYGSEPYVRFGNDNLYPQIINQCYYSSPLNGSIINFKTNAVIGGGFEIVSDDTTALQKVKEYTFIKKNKFNKVVRQISKDLIMHGRICIIIDPTNKDISIKRVGPERVRVNNNKSIYTTSDDWSRSVNMVEYPLYNPSLTCKSMFIYEIDGDAGQDIYPIPQYCSALNDAYLDGEIPYLQKSNIINSIFPSFMITIAKKFGNQEEINAFKDTINKAKGAPEAGRIMTFVANSADQLPKIDAIPSNGNDKIFDSTTQRVDANICRAHSIDPLLMGIRVSGSLGNGNELNQSYTIFEKNVVMPLRELITEACDEILAIGKLNSTITINDYQIISGEIVDKTNPIK
jgi:capsid portal protein